VKLQAPPPRRMKLQAPPPRRAKLQTPPRKAKLACRRVPAPTPLQTPARRNRAERVRQKLTQARRLPRQRPTRGQQQELRTTVLWPQQVVQTLKKLVVRLLWALRKGRLKDSG